MIETRRIDVAATAAHQRSARLAVHLAGAGPLAVLVHGFPLDHRMWTDVLHGPLAQRRTLCAIDLRGHGGSPWCGDDVHTMQQFARDVAAVIGTLGDGPADVCGLSMGGYVALALAAEAPQLVRSLVLTNTRATADTDTQRAGREQAITTVVQEGRAALAAGMLSKLTAPDCEPLRVAQLRTMLEAQPTESIVADLRGLQQRPDRTGELTAIAAETLVVAGEHDAITPADEMRAFARQIPGARFEIVSGTGHMSPLEQPHAWSEVVGSFWR